MAVLARVEPPVGSEHQSIGSSGVFLEYRHCIAVHILGALLQETAQGLSLHFPDERGIDGIAAESGESPDEAEHAAERIGTVPCGIERPIPARARAGNRTVIRIGGEIV